MKKKLTAILLITVLALATLVGCGKQEADDLSTVKANGKLIVGVSEYVPWTYRKGDRWVGFDIEMATLFAQRLGVEAEFVEIDWDDKVTALNNGIVDCIWNGMILNDEVENAMSCSEPYCHEALLVIVPEAEAGKYSSAEACKKLTFAVEDESVGMLQAQERGFRYLRVKDQENALMKVDAGVCDAAIVDSVTAAALTGEGSKYAGLVCALTLTEEEYGVGFRLGSALPEELNAFFNECAANGKLEEIAAKYKVQPVLAG